MKRSRVATKSSLLALVVGLLVGLAPSLAPALSLTRGTPTTLTGTLGDVQASYVADFVTLTGYIDATGLVNPAPVPLFARRLQYDLLNKVGNGTIFEYRVDYPRGTGLIGAADPEGYFDGAGVQQTFWAALRGVELFDKGFGPYNYDDSEWQIDYQADHVTWRQIGNGFIPDTATGATNFGFNPTFALFFAPDTPLGLMPASVAGRTAAGGPVTAAGKVLSASGDPNVEVDVFPDTRAVVGIMMPDGSAETLTLHGPSVAEVQLGKLADSDGDGREQVPSEMVQLELTGTSPTLGPVTLRLRDPAKRPFRRSLGEIEENVNNTPGTLDIPPFTPVGTADSFFDVFFEVEVGGQVFHSEAPSRMESTISHKPPAPGNTYNKPPGNIPLFDEKGNDTGIRIIQASHEPNPGDVEVDLFPDSRAVLDINGPLGPDTAVLMGPTRVEVAIFNLADPDGNGREQVGTEIVAMELTGSSPLYGPITMRLRDAMKHPFMRSTGEIEETTNTQIGRLDLPPFAPSGSADSFFDVFFEIELADGTILHNWVPKRMQQVITYKPPRWGQFYAGLQTIDLYDENNRPTGISIGAGRHVPDTTEVDFFPDTRATVELICPNMPPETIQLAGPTTVNVDLAALGDPDGDTREQVPTEMVSMELTGTSPTLGPVTLRESPALATIGEIEETVNNTPGVLDLPPFTATGSADSFFDVFFEIELPNAGLTLHNEVPQHMGTVITHKPPAAGNLYQGVDNIELFDPAGNPTGCFLGAASHLPEPIEVDHFEDSRAVFELIAPDGTTALVTLNGPTTVEVDLGALADTDGDTREQVPTEITAMELTGSSPMGPILLRQSSTVRTLGEIEETTNTQPGRLDLPPFAPSGSADSFFDVFFEIVLSDGTVLHNEAPKHLRTVITHKPPAELEFYETVEAIPLFDANGNPTGFSLGAGRHMPVPIEVDRFEDTLATVELTCPNLPTETVVLRGPTTVHVDLARLGDTEPVPDGREQVPTEIVDLRLTGVSPTLGLITLQQSPIQPSVGEIEEIVNRTPGVLDLPPFTPAGSADSFFDVFVEVDLPGVGLHLHNRSPKRLQGRITHKPAAPCEGYEGLDKIALFDPNEEPTGCVLGAMHHIPLSPTGPDSDQDGVSDACDNCLRAPNGPLAPDAGGHSQWDTNGDAIGNVCDCDFNNDNFCGGPDFTLFIGCFNQLAGSNPTCQAADMNGDGFVGGPDFTLFIGGFNGPPGPAAP